MKIAIATVAMITLTACTPATHTGDDSTGYAASEIGMALHLDDTPATPDNGSDTPATPATPDNGSDTPATSGKSNASANNGKGGNYGKTGHADNGEGKARDKK